MIRGTCRKVQVALVAKSIPLTLNPSAEYRLNPKTWPEVKRKRWLLPFDDNHILIELPVSHPEMMGDLSLEEEASWLQSHGYVAVLAHPERYRYLNLGMVRDMVRRGSLLFQCNYGSLVGAYGRDAMAVAKNLAAHGEVSYWGTDMHNARYFETLDRYFECPEAYI